MLRVAFSLQSLVWLVNGLYCKVLQLVPRHEAIVGRILGQRHAAIFTQLIGFGEILLSVWIASLIRSRLAIILQILLVASMNIIEAILAPDQLLFGYGNAMLAALYIALLLICYRALTSSRGRIF